MQKNAAQLVSRVFWQKMVWFSATGNEPNSMENIENCCSIKQYFYLVTFKVLWHSLNWSSKWYLNAVLLESVNSMDTLIRCHMYSLGIDLLCWWPQHNPYLMPVSGVFHRTILGFIKQLFQTFGPNKIIASCNWNQKVSFNRFGRSVWD